MGTWSRARLEASKSAFSFGWIVASMVWFSAALAGCGTPNQNGSGGAGAAGGATGTTTKPSDGGGGVGGVGGCSDPPQSAGDCKKNVCVSGQITAIADNTDLPNDSKQCTDDTCVDGEPVNPSSAAGTACTENGGKVCDGSGKCVACLTTKDCETGFTCSSILTCVPISCANGTKDGDETDVDCGGACGPTCLPNQACVDGDDCLEKVCAMGACLVSTCADGVQNGDETDVDCGGTCALGFSPKKCAPDQGCMVDKDCVGDECTGSFCVPNCSDGVKNANETDQDCGGPACVPCPNGYDCSIGADCSTGFCVSSICCSTACAGECDACSATEKGGGQNGVCGPVLPGKLCGSGPSCTNNTAKLQDTCNILGQCETTTTACKPYVCDVDACKTSCVDDTECQAPATCAGGVCTQGDGGPCTTAAECLSGFCVDGVCCESNCTGLCQACSVAKKGTGQNGVCGDVAAGTDPDNECTGACGGGQCQSLNGQACTTGAECSSGNCVDGLCCNLPCAGVCQACSVAKKGAGLDGACGNIASNSDPDNECGGATTCNGSGACSLLPVGSLCTSNGECSSSFCVDGVCCSSACNTSCQACSAAKKGSGADGGCGTILAGTDPDDECPGAQVCTAAGCKLPNGALCMSAASCQSGFCTDGVCCSAACTGACQACTAAKKGAGVDGVCDNILSGNDPDNECTGAVSCSGSGTCALLTNGVACTQNGECTSGICTEGVCCNSTCTSTCQSCLAAKKGNGTDGTCGSMTAGLDPDNECPGNAACGGGTTCTLLANGAPCTIAAECASNACVDGVCCNTTCTAVCNACTAAKRGSGVDGTCGTIAVGTDPDSECAGPTSCSGASSCSLLANGAACAANAECTSGSCVDGVCCNTACNTACVACTAAKKGSGADGTCGNIASGADPDSECLGTQICNGVGACKIPLADACTQNVDCLSGFCADGVCCSAACTGVCQACTAAKKGTGADGTCGNIALSTDPDNECFGAFSCSGSGTCSLLAQGAACTANGECASTFCVDGVCCNGACNTLCNACTALKKGTGADGTCGTVAASTDPDSECPGTQVCNGASAQCKAPLGEACLLATDCASGFCADGVCCNAACSGSCQACTATKKGTGADGVCGNVNVGTDPDNECFGAIACNGSGACGSLVQGSVCTANGECASGSCVDGFCCNSACNTLCNACSAAKKGSGLDGTCGVIASGADPDAECAGSQVCNGASLCKLPNGDACVNATDCVAGFCADGVCCNAACTGACQACTAAKKGTGLDGACGNINVGTDPDNECFGVASCNGSGACALASPGAVCAANGECASGFCVDGVCCNTACNTLCNACTAVKKGSGTDGTCGVVASGLDPDNECAGTQVCNGASLCKAPNGDACVANADCVSNACVDGVCCNTTCTGACQACTAAKKGTGADGVCGSITMGTDPDNECFGAISCNGSGACGTLVQGSVCTANGECASGSCVDGFCCNTACNTLCNACSAAKKGTGADGTCGVVTAGLDPDNECAGTQVCNGASLCKAPNGDACTLGADCVSTFCADGVCCNGACNTTCTACTAAKKGSGSDGVCGNVGLGLDPDNECFSTFSCNGAGACGLLANGATCTQNAECTSNFCVDGVCCNTVCNTLCNACTAAKRGTGADGTCGVINANQDPDSECPGASSCGGASTCALFANGVACTINGECSSGNCVDGFCCNTACNGTCQACSLAKKGSGANGTCGAVGTNTDPDNECPGSTTCNASSVCALFANGTACSIGGECASGSCVDNVCCNTACSGLCQACVAAKTGGTNGTCADIVTGTDPDNECTSPPNCAPNQQCGP